MRIITMLIAGGLGTLGFNLMFKVNLRHIPVATLGGIISTGIYVFFDALGANVFVSNFIAMLIAAMISEIFARIFRAPAAVFLLPCTIPLVPGGSLYYTMSNLMFENYDAMLNYGKSTLLTGLGIAAGMITASVIWNTLSHVVLKKSKEKSEIGKHE